MFKFERTSRNTSQQDGQTRATCCPHQCCDMLRWNVAIIWPGLYEYREFREFFIILHYLQIIILHKGTLQGK